MRSWHFTLLLGAAYLAIFHLWLVLPQEWVAASGTAAGATLLVLLWRAWRRDYFANRWDTAFHATVVLDIFLEAWLIKNHQDFGFYWCALGFGVVLAAYRISVFRGWEPRSTTGGKNVVAA